MNRVKQLDERQTAVIGFESGDLKFYDLRTSSAFVKIRPTEAAVTCLDVSPDDYYLYFGFSNGAISKYDIRNSSLVSSVLVKKYSFFILIILKVHDIKDGEGVLDIQITDKRCFASAGADGKISIMK